jgi:hypothetical protein
VGSHATSMLLRSGVGRLRIVDFDQVRDRPPRFLATFSLSSHGCSLHLWPGLPLPCPDSPFAQVAHCYRLSPGSKPIRCFPTSLCSPLVHAQVGSSWTVQLLPLHSTASAMSGEGLKSVVEQRYSRPSFQVSLSSLNRHAVATREDVGTPKAVCMQRHFARIFPEAQVEALPLMYDTSTEEEVLAGSPHFVLDCIDNIDTKVGPRTGHHSQDKAQEHRLLVHFRVWHRSGSISSISRDAPPPWLFCAVHSGLALCVQVALLAACKHRGLRVVSATGKCAGAPSFHSLNPPLGIVSRWGSVSACRSGAGRRGRRLSDF